MALREHPIARRRGVCCEVDLVVPAGPAKAAAALLRVLGDPTRLSMLATLREVRRPVCVCDFTAVYGLSQPTISHHMARLREAGLVESEKRGLWVHYRAADPLPEPVDRLLAALFA